MEVALKKIILVLVGLLIVSLIVSCSSGKKSDEKMPEASELATNTEEAIVPETPVQDTAAVKEFQRIYFDYDKYDIRADAAEILKENAKYLKENKDVVIQVEGHCDDRGSNEYNLALGEKRAKAAKQYLVNLGIAKKRISTISFGEEKPLVPGSDESAWAQNRRAEFVIVSKGR